MYPLEIQLTWHSHSPHDLRVENSQFVALQLPVRHYLHMIGIDLNVWGRLFKPPVLVRMMQYNIKLLHLSYNYRICDDRSVELDLICVLTCHHEWSRGTSMKHGWSRGQQTCLQLEIVEQIFCGSRGNLYLLQRQSCGQNK